MSSCIESERLQKEKTCKWTCSGGKRVASRRQDQLCSFPFKWSFFQAQSAFLRLQKQSESKRRPSFGILIKIRRLDGTSPIYHIVADVRRPALLSYSILFNRLFPPNGLVHHTSGLSWPCFRCSRSVARAFRDDMTCAEALVCLRGSPNPRRLGQLTESGRNA